jgi:putative ABC transport system substrate-binding protein
MRRRDFVKGIAGSAIGWPLAVRAQQAERVRRIGVLMGYPDSEPEGQAYVVAFAQALQQLGWAQGSNLRIEIRWAPPGNTEALHRFAKELVALQPDLIISHSTPTTAALLEQTRSIPIVFVFVSDPLGSGFVANFPHPGGNVTGFIVMEPGIAGKWLELLKQIAPRVARVAILFNPTTAPYANYYLEPFKAAARSFAAQETIAPVRDGSELESVIAAQASEPNGGFVVMPDAFTDTYRKQIISLAARYDLPAVYPFRYWAKDGGLLSYGVDQIDNFRRAAVYADRILKGEKPGDLPASAEQVPTGDQLKDSESSWSNGISRLPASRRRGDRMRRREFITLLGGAAAVSWPLVVRAQQHDEVRHIGVLVNKAADDPEAQARDAASASEPSQDNLFGADIRQDCR